MYHTLSKNITDCNEEHLKEQLFKEWRERADEEHKKKVRKKELRKKRKKELREKKPCEICQQVLKVETCQTRETSYIQHLKEEHMEGICVLHMDKNGWKFRCPTCGQRYKDLERVVYHVEWYCEGCSITCEVCESNSYGTSTIISVL